MQELETKIAADKVVFNIDENNEFPTVLFEGKTFDEIAKLLGSEFIVLQDKDVIVQRVMTDEEISVDDWRVINRVLKATEDTTLGEIHEWYNKYQGKRRDLHITIDSID